jgi:hypothetical protein
MPIFSPNGIPPELPVFLGCADCVEALAGVVVGEVVGLVDVMLPCKEARAALNDAGFSRLISAPQVSSAEKLPHAIFVTV